MRNVWLFGIKIQFYIWLLFVEKLINNICFNNCLYLWDYGWYIICNYEYMKSTLVVDISIVKNWFKVYWIIRRVKYTLFYWLIKEYWILNYLGSGIEVLWGVDFWGNGDFNWKKFLWDISGTTSSYLAKIYHIRQQNPPRLKYYNGH